MTKKLFLIFFTLITVFNSNCLAQKSEKQTKIIISTSYGDIKLLLYNETPKHRDNFIKLVKEGFYDNTLFHRIIKDFMIQGGDPDSKNAAAGTMLGEGEIGYTIPAEFNASLIHKKGVLAAARQADNVNPNKESSGCQFYIVQGKPFSRAEVDKIIKRKNAGREIIISYSEEQYKIYETIGGTPHLDMDYTIFGEVLEGLEVIDKIAAAEKDRNDRPKEDIKMTIKIVKK
ncbi:MAG: peptidylprolyl isomerase [Flavobacteriales bacterium CG_4_9_14_3_um_filter_32_8]|nr:MAG: peptidylprolyl isomerase [Flavobacteriales bacterium CG_4_9_14_3_um_filter_32_8]